MGEFENLQLSSSHNGFSQKWTLLWLIPHCLEWDKVPFWCRHHHGHIVSLLWDLPHESFVETNWISLFFCSSLSSFSLSLWTLSACPLFSPLGSSPLRFTYPLHRYRKTQETLSQAGQVTSAALSSMGAAITQRIGTMRWWFSTFKQRSLHVATVSSLLHNAIILS